MRKKGQYLSSSVAGYILVNGRLEWQVSLSSSCVRKVLEPSCPSVMTPFPYVRCYHLYRSDENRCIQRAQWQFPILFLFYEVVHQKSSYAHRTWSFSQQTWLSITNPEMQIWFQHQEEVGSTYEQTDADDSLRKSYRQAVAVRVWTFAGN